jgi:hypothetical protein
MSLNLHVSRVKVIIETESNLRVVNINNSINIIFRRIIFKIDSSKVINYLFLYLFSGLFSEYLLGYCRFNIGIRIAFSSIYSLFNYKNGPPQNNVLGK